MLEKILEEIEAYRKIACEGKNYNSAAAFEICDEIIRKHMNEGWISCEERLPEGNAVNPVTRDAYVYPVTVDLGGVTDTRYYSFFKGHWYNQSPKIMDDLVIAWKERPEPYRPEKGVEE